MKFKKEWTRDEITTIIVAGVFVLGVFVLAFLFLFYNSSNPESVFFENNTVINVIDGDTFEYVQIIDSSKFIVTVRLLCVDTPEVNHTGYQEAKDYLESLILNKQVILVSSEVGANVDGYGRALRYAYIDGLFVNKDMLDKKYGELLIMPPETCDKVR